MAGFLAENLGQALCEEKQSRVVELSSEANQDLVMTTGPAPGKGLTRCCVVRLCSTTGHVRRVSEEEVNLCIGEGLI